MLVAFSDTGSDTGISLEGTPGVSADWSLGDVKGILTSCGCWEAIIYIYYNLYILEGNRMSGTKNPSPRNTLLYSVGVAAAARGIPSGAVPEDRRRSLSHILPQSLLQKSVAMKGSYPVETRHF